MTHNVSTKVTADGQMAFNWSKRLPASQMEQAAKWGCAEARPDWWRRQQQQQQQQVSVGHRLLVFKAFEGLAEACQLWPPPKSTNMMQGKESTSRHLPHNDPSAQGAHGCKSRSKTDASQCLLRMQGHHMNYSRCARM